MISDAVFVYGSLVGEAAARPGARWARLPGFRREWGVAMDNRLDLPGYKFYTAPAAPGDRPPARPDVHVAFLDLRPARGASVLGVIRPVDSAELPALDARERNYRRVRVDDRLDEGTAERVWAYVGTDAARARFAIGPTVIHAGYLREVLAGFAELPAPTRADVADELSPGGLPVCELTRHELPDPLRPARRSGRPSRRGRKLTV